MARVKPNNKIAKRVLACLGAAFLTMSIVGCTQKEEAPRIVVEDSDNSMTYNLVQVTKDTVAKTESIRCSYRKIGEEEVHLSDSGKLVDKVYVQKGDTVHAGDVLVELSAGNLSKEISQLEYQIARNELQLGYLNEQENLDQQSIWMNYVYYSSQTPEEKKQVEDSIANLEYGNQTRREDIEDALEFDRRKLQSLKGQLANSRVYASMDGVVYSMKDNLEGSTSNIEDVIMVIVDNSEGFFEGKNDSMMEYFHEGDELKLTITTGTAHGDYVVTPMDIDSWEDVPKFSVLSGAEVEEIEAGTNATLTVVLDEKQDVLSVPAGCVYQADGKYYVYVLDDNGMRQVCWIEIGLYGDNKVEIIKGLSEGDTVIKR